jgi:hypothetical protein
MTLTQEIHRDLQAKGLMAYSYPRLRIGLDLDDTVYGHPGFFRALVDAMHAAGHKLICISAHGPAQWEPVDVPRLRALGIDASKIDPSGMTDWIGGYDRKADAIERLCDFAFDDNAEQLKPLTSKPIFTSPVGK